MQRVASGVTTQYVYDAQGQLAAEFSSQTPTVTGTEYLVADHLGSTRMATNSSGGCLQLHDYLPFGEDTINGAKGEGVSLTQGEGVSPRRLRWPCVSPSIRCRVMHHGGSIAIKRVRRILPCQSPCSPCIYGVLKDLTAKNHALGGANRAPPCMYGFLKDLAELKRFSLTRQRERLRGQMKARGMRERTVQ